MKIRIATDSNSGITQMQAESLGVSVLPMPFTIGGVDYYEDINLTQEGFYEKLADGVDIHTSQPAPESLMEFWRGILATGYDRVIYIPMSSGLSGSCQAAMMLADEDEFAGQVLVVDNQRISVTLRQSVLDAQMLADAGIDAERIRDFLEQDKLNATIYIMLDTLTYLKKGGRITPAAAALGTVLKIKPVLQIQGEKLDAFAKARTPAKGKQIMLDALREDIDRRFGGIGNVHIAMAYTQDLVSAMIFKGEVAACFPDNEIHMDPLSLSVACHIGPGALAVTAVRTVRPEDVG